MRFGKTFIIFSSVKNFWKSKKLKPITYKVQASFLDTLCKVNVGKLEPVFVE